MNGAGRRRGRTGGRGSGTVSVPEASRSARTPVRGGSRDRGHDGVVLRPALHGPFTTLAQGPRPRRPPGVSPRSGCSRATGRPPGGVVPPFPAAGPRTAFAAAVRHTPARRAGPLFPNGWARAGRWALPGDEGAQEPSTRPGVRGARRRPPGGRVGRYGPYVRPAHRGEGDGAYRGAVVRRACGAPGRRAVRGAGGPPGISPAVHGRRTGGCTGSARSAGGPSNPPRSQRSCTGGAEPRGSGQQKARSLATGDAPATGHLER